MTAALWMLAIALILPTVIGLGLLTAWLIVMIFGKP